MALPELDAQDLAELAIFPLPSATLFPGAALPLHVFEPRYRELVRYVLARRKVMAVARLKPGFEAAYEGRPPVFEACGVGVIESHNQRPDGRFDLTLRGLGRIRIVEELPPLHAFRSVRAVRVTEREVPPALLGAWQTKLRALWDQLAPHLPQPARDLRVLTRDAEGASAYTDRLAAALIADPDASQQLLAEADPGERLRLLTARVQELVDALSPRGVARERALN
jgi:Lon protease-like protein